jgi:hypothetical protein
VRPGSRLRAFVPSLPLLRMVLRLMQLEGAVRAPKGEKKWTDAGFRLVEGPWEGRGGEGQGEGRERGGGEGGGESIFFTGETREKPGSLL